MLKVLKILVMAHALIGCAAVLSACGQKGPLFLPTSPESAGRATLPQTLHLWPANAAAAPTSAPTAEQNAGPHDATKKSLTQTAPIHPDSGKPGAPSPLIPAAVVPNSTPASSTAPAQ